jgi:hypothetical protein
MIPTQVPEPFHRDGWVYEEKVECGWIARREHLEVAAKYRT